MPRIIGILLVDGAEEMDFVGPMGGVHRVTQRSPRDRPRVRPLYCYRRSHDPLRRPGNSHSLG
jgi:hypothetical protein